MVAESVVVFAGLLGESKVIDEMKGGGRERDESYKLGSVCPVMSEWRAHFLVQIVSQKDLRYWSMLRCLRSGCCGLCLPSAALV